MTNLFITIQNFAAGSGCKAEFFGFPTWYQYLKTQPPDCVPQLGSINDIWLIGLALINILLRVAILAAIGFILFSGIKYAASRGNADKIDAAKKTLGDAIIGLVIAIIATALVSFIAGRFTQ